MIDVISCGFRSTLVRYRHKKLKRARWGIKLEDNNNCWWETGNKDQSLRPKSHMLCRLIHPLRRPPDMAEQLCDNVPPLHAFVPDEQEPEVSGGLSKLEHGSSSSIEHAEV